MNPSQDNPSEFEHAREHLANERTFLAWVRTSLGVAGLGFVVVKFSLFVRELKFVVPTSSAKDHSPGYSLPLGIILIMIGALITSVAYFRYRRIQKQIFKETFTQSNTLTIVMTISLISACMLLVVYLLLTT